MKASLSYTSSSELVKIRRRDLERSAPCTFSGRAPDLGSERANITEAEIIGDNLRTISPVLLTCTYDQEVRSAHDRNQGEVSCENSCRKRAGLVVTECSPEMTDDGAICADCRQLARHGHDIAVHSYQCRRRLGRCIEARDIPGEYSEISGIS